MGSRSDESESMHEKRALKLDEEKENLMHLFTAQEDEFKSKIDTLSKENEKAKEHITQSIESNNDLVQKVNIIGKNLNDSRQLVKQFKEELESKTKEFESKMQEKDQEVIKCQEQIIQDKHEIERLSHSNDDEKEKLKIFKADIDAQKVKNQIELQSLEKLLEVAEQKFKLKAQEIYDLRELYQKQSNDIELIESSYNTDSQDKIVSTKSIKLLPDFQDGHPTPRSTGVITKEEKQKNIEAKKISESFQNYQDKVKNLSEELYDVKNELLEKDLEINKLKNNIKQHEADSDSTKIQVHHLKAKIETMEQRIENMKEEYNQITETRKKQDESLRNSEKYIFSLTKFLLYREFSEALDKITLLKKELDSKSSGQNKQSLERQTNETSKLISRLMNVLIKAKKVHELKDKSMQNLNKSQ